jgi:DNA-binding CsgD family transcriptional regulator
VVTTREGARVLVGRDRELARIRSVLHSARIGRAGTLVLRGEAGAGKTALLDRAAAEARRDSVLRVRGVESERELSFGALSALVRPVLEAVPSLPAAQRAALLGALSLVDAPTNELAVCAGTLALLAALAERRPLMVIVDDAQWIDEPTARCLTFAARRLLADRVALLFGLRDDDTGTLDTTDLDVIDLDGLDGRGAHELLKGCAVAPPVADELRRATSGNPLALLEAAAALDDDQRAGRRALPDPLPVGDALERAFGRRIQRLSQRAARALLVLAADAAADPTALDVETAALEEAESAGIVRLDGGRAEFAHPLVRAAVYHGATPSERRRIHRRLASVLQAAGDPERYAWHLAAAATGPDEAAAAALEAASAAAEQRGALITSARELERAARLTPARREATRRLLGAGRAGWRAGRVGPAIPLLDEVIGTTDDGLVRADAVLLRGQAETWRTGPRRGAELLIIEADEVEAHDPERAAVLLAHAVNALLLAGEAGQAAALAARAEAAAARGAGPAMVCATAAQAQAALVHGETQHALALLGPLGQLAEALSAADVPEAEHLVQVLAFAHLVLEQWEEAERVADQTIRQARRSGALGVMGFATAVLADINWRTGHWERAVALATNDLTESFGADLPVATGYAEAVRARIHAGRGGESGCKEHAAAALRIGCDLDIAAITIWARSALGLLHLGAGEYQAALGVLEPVRRAYETGEIGEPGVCWWAGDYIEALMGVGRTADAARQVARLEEQAQTTGRNWARGAACRGRAMLQTGTGVEEAFGEALDSFTRAKAPFEQARTQLRRGEHRLARGDHAGGRADLSEVVEQFESLGAWPWATTARRLLGAEPRRRRAPAPDRTLTASELRVALAVGSGATNREAAEELYLSAKTVDFYLQNIYRKLGIRSRTELALLIARNQLSS